MQPHVPQESDQFVNFCQRKLSSSIYIPSLSCPNCLRDIKAFTVCYVVGGLPQPAGLSAAGPLVQSVAPRAAACHMAA